MKKNLTSAAGVGLAALAAVPAGAQGLTLTALPVTLSGGLYGYNYTFTDTGASQVDTLELTSADLAPLNLTFLKDGAATTWQSVGGPSGALLMYGNGDTMNPGDTLNVQFADPASLFTPAPGQAAVGFSQTTGAQFAVSGVVAGPAAATVPEAGSLALLALGVLPVFGFAARRKTAGR